MPSGRVFVGGHGDAFDEMARAWIAAGRPVATPRLAATVMLVRDAAAGVEVFVQERAATMAFAPATVVFPGGRLDEADWSAAVTGRARELAGLMGVTEQQAQAILTAAVREVAEECGVQVSPADLVPRARWLTPALDPRRYDTWFFAAAMPADQDARGTTRETTTDEWGRPTDLLTAREQGRIRLMPPTIATLEQLSVFATVAEVLADRPSLALIEPQLVETADGYALHSVLP